MRRTARRIKRPSVAERKAKARDNRNAECVVAVKIMLSQHAEMKAAGRMNLSELEWVLFQIGRAHV